MEKSEMRKCFFVFLLLGLGFSSCSSKDEPTDDLGADLSLKDMSTDQGSKDLMATDTSKDIAVDTIDGQDDLSQDVAPDLMTNKLLTLTRTKDGAEFPFTDFYYGKNSDGTLRLEAMVGGTGSCPTMNSPTPDETMILNIDPMTRAHKDAVVLDFAGHFDAISPNHPTTLKVDEFTFDTFGESLEMQLSGIDKHDVSHFSFKGQVYAIYCPSLDE